MTEQPDRTLFAASYGVRDPLPKRCHVHGLLVKVDKIVGVVR